MEKQPNEMDRDVTGDDQNTDEIMGSDIESSKIEAATDVDAGEAKPGN